MSAGVETRGSLLIAGGALTSSSRTVFRRLSELASGGGIAVFGTASREPARVAALAVADIAEAGGNATALEVTAQSSSDPGLLEALRGCNGFWFEGGDQRRIAAAFADTPALEVIRERFVAGAVIGGTSAGAAIMGQTMIAGGSSLEALQRGAAMLKAGLGFMRGAITDQHCSQRGRFARLILALLQTGTALGVGVDEDTALLIPPSGAWRVIGSMTVTLLERHHGRLGVSLLRHGDAFDPLTGGLHISSLPERPVPSPNDPLEPNGFTQLLEDFASHSSLQLERAIQAGPNRWKLKLQKTAPESRSPKRIAVWLEPD